MFVSLVNTPSTVRSVSITKVARLLGRGPKRLTPNCRAMSLSGSESKAKPSPFFSSKACCRSTGSALIPTRLAPSSLNSASRSRK